MFILHRWGWAVFLLIVTALFVTIQIPLSNIKIFKVHTYECSTNGALCHYNSLIQYTLESVF